MREKYYELQNQTPDLPEHAIYIAEPLKITVKRKFMVIDGMHRVTAMQQLVKKHGVGGKYDVIPCGTLYAREKLTIHLLIFLADSANDAAGTLAKKVIIDKIDSK